MLTDDLQAVLQARFGFSALRRGQTEIVASVLAGRDALAVLPTGGGKSLCYQLPAVARSGITLVISPLISLMDDQVSSLQQKGIAAGAIHSGHELDDKRSVFQDLRQTDRFLLYVSPERIQTPRFLEWFRQQQIALVAIDEAHCISQWGHDFRPEYQRISVLRELRPEVPMLALTATATPLVLDDIATTLKLSEPDRHVYGFYRPNLYYQVEFCDNDAQKFSYITDGIRQFPKGRIIVYCGTRKQTEELSAALSQLFSGVGYYHGGLDTGVREDIQKRYDRGETRILCATNAFGMGIDHPDVRLVMHFQMPGNIESLYQEMGRAGRDGNDSTCLLLYSKRDKGLHAFFIEQSGAVGKVRNQRWDALNTLVQYAEGGDCRHAGILTYFRDAQRLESCGHCDSCDVDSPRRVRSAEAALTQATGEAMAGKKKKIAKAKKVTLAVDAGKALEGEALERQRALKAWRKEFAQKNDMPAFVVFSNKTLREMAVHNPETDAELLAISGIGEQKLEAYGTEILRVLRSLS